MREKGRINGQTVGGHAEGEGSSSRDSGYHRREGGISESELHGSASYNRVQICGLSWVYLIN